MSTQPIQPTKTNFLNCALVLTERGIPVVPVPAREKAAKLKGWPELATTNTDQLEVWNNQNPEQNTAAVAFAVPGGIWVLDCDVPNLRERIEAELGAKLPSTYTVKSSKGIHIYWKQTPRSIAMGNIPSAEVHDKLFDAQVHRKYVVGPGSIHPSGVMYTVIDDSPIVEAPDALIDWILSQRKSQTADKVTTVAESAELQSKIDDMAEFLKHCGVGYDLRGADKINHDKHAAYFILAACPRNPAHVGTSAAIIVFKDGKYGYKCQHADCIGVVENQPEPKKSAWALIREIIDPQREYRFKRPPMEFGDVYDWDGVSATVSTPDSRATSAAKTSLWDAATKLSALPEAKYEWLVEGVFAKNELTYLTGDFGSFKTYLAMFAAEAIASGKTLFGRETQQHPVLILDRENSQQTWSMRRYMIEDLATELPIRLLGRFTTPRAPDLNDPALLAACTEIKPFIIVDSFQDFHIGLKEDKADDMTIVGHWLDGLIDAGAVGVLVLHHVPKSSSGSRAGKYRGSTAIVGGAGAAMTIEKTGSFTAMVSGFKTRDGEDMSLSLKFTFPTQAEIDAKTGKVTCVAIGAKNVTPQDRLSERILDCVKKHPGITKTAIVQMIGGNRNAIFAMTGTLIADKKLAVDDGKISRAATAVETPRAEDEKLGF